MYVRSLQAASFFFALLVFWRALGPRWNDRFTWLLRAVLLLISLAMRCCAMICHDIEKLRRHAVRFFLTHGSLISLVSLQEGGAIDMAHACITFRARAIHNRSRYQYQ